KLSNTRLESRIKNKIDYGSFSVKSLKSSKFINSYTILSDDYDFQKKYIVEKNTKFYHRNIRDSIASRSRELVTEFKEIISSISLVSQDNKSRQRKENIEMAIIEKEKPKFDDRIRNKLIQEYLSKNKIVTLKEDILLMESEKQPKINESMHKNVSLAIEALQRYKESILNQKKAINTEIKCLLDDKIRTISIIKALNKLMSGKNDEVSVDNFCHTSEFTEM
ncbi:MAG: hypothetical protein MHPSP_003172, partial [Paramarteilia canceri]